MAFESTVNKRFGPDWADQDWAVMFMELDFKPAKRPVAGMMLGRK
jgi:hypothetical protein